MRTIEDLRKIVETKNYPEEFKAELLELLPLISDLNQDNDKLYDKLSVYEVKYAPKFSELVDSYRVYDKLNLALIKKDDDLNMKHVTLGIVMGLLSRRKENKYPAINKGIEEVILNYFVGNLYKEGLPSDEYQVCTSLEPVIGLETFSKSFIAEDDSLLETKIKEKGLENLVPLIEHNYQLRCSGGKSQLDKITEELKNKGINTVCIINTTGQSVSPEEDKKYLEDRAVKPTEEIINIEDTQVIEPDEIETQIGTVKFK